MIREVPQGETLLAAPVLLHLRPDFETAEALAEAADAMRSGGYRIAASFEGDAVAAAAGFRVMTNLVSGRHLYVDDLVTGPDHRRRGHAAALLDWCGREAERLGCASLQLDSGVGPERRDAHALYFREGMGIRSYHFTREL